MTHSDAILAPVVMHSAGARIGAYEIIAKLGEGGMGEVYRARDTKLGRDVALKILPPAFTADADRLARFQREARVLASVNHPHIAAIYGFEDTGAVPSLVLELVEGETLEHQLRHGPLPLPRALNVAHQIGDALDAAHSHGIVHRDLKPSNIKITPDEVVKVLDFGLAKAQPIEDAPADLSKSPTMASDGTNAGVILGTAAYMSPEQARGKPVDKRTDIWAFGCLLYEMLTARPAFHGETMSDTIAAILERRPDWSALPPGTPPEVRRLMERCLEGDPRRRLRDIGDARHWLDESPISESPMATSAAPSLARSLAWLAGGVALASVLFAAWSLSRAPADAPARSVQFQRLTDFVGMEESPAISPDGKTVAFIAPAGGRRQIWLRLLAGGAPLQITRDEVDHERPRWTPDSSALIYYTPSTPGEHGTIWEISALGGQPRRLASSLGAGEISHDGRRLALFRFQDNRTVLVIATRDGSAADQVRPLPINHAFERPRWSPDDRWIAYQQENLVITFDTELIVVPAAADGEARQVARTVTIAGHAWKPDGSGLVYSSSAGSTVLYPPRFNLRAVDRDGTGDQQLTFGDVSYVEPDVHASGYITASRIRMQSDIWKFPVDGTPAENTRRGTRITFQTGQAQTPAISPDESEVVYLSDSGGHGNLWIARTDGSSVRQITFETDPARSVGVPVWSPTSDQIVFILTRQGATGLSIINRDGSGQRELIPGGYSAHWSQDGRWMYYAKDAKDTICVEKRHIDERRVVPIRCGNTNAVAPAPDGSTLYFVTLLIGRNGMLDHEINRARPEDGPAETLARVAGAQVPITRRLFVPVLSPDGQFLTFPLLEGNTSNIWALPTAGGPMRRLTDFGDRPVVIGRRVSWSRDSKSLYAAVADTDADVVMMEGLLSTGAAKN